MAGFFGMNKIYSLIHLIVNTNTSPIDKQVGFRHNDGIENWYWAVAMISCTCEYNCMDMYESSSLPCQPVSTLCQIWGPPGLASLVPLDAWQADRSVHKGSMKYLWPLWIRLWIFDIVILHFCWTHHIPIRIRAPQQSRWAPKTNQRKSSQALTNRFQPVKMQHCRY